jgi:hypothetical protein
MMIINNKPNPSLIEQLSQSTGGNDSGYFYGDQSNMDPGMGYDTNYSGTWSLPRSGENYDPFGPQSGQTPTPGVPGSGGAGETSTPGTSSGTSQLTGTWTPLTTDKTSTAGKTQTPTYGGRYGTPLSTTSTSTGTTETTKTPTMPLPTLGTTEPYTNPAWSKEQIKAYAQEDSALGISEARDALYQGINKVVSMQGNPTAQAAAMRDLLRGHGGAIAKVMQGANKEALSRYQVQYQYQVNEAMTRFNSLRADAYARYKAEMEQYLGTMRQSSVQNQTTTQSYV